TLMQQERRAPAPREGSRETGPLGAPASLPAISENLGLAGKDTGAPGLRAMEPYRPIGYSRFLDKDGYPAIKPPWGLLNAIDLNEGEILWKVPLGEFPELTARGIPITGTENFGGTIVTAGGLVFIGGSKDEKFHAFDKTTGKLLWDHKLDAGGYATPCT